MRKSRTAPQSTDLSNDDPSASAVILTTDPLCRLSSHRIRSRTAWWYATVFHLVSRDLGIVRPNMDP